jgi:hypothetical protein
MDDWAWEQLEPWLAARVELPVGPLFCVVNGPTRGRPWSASAARSELRCVARGVGVRRRFAPHQLRHAHAVGWPARAYRWLLSNGSSGTEIIDTVHPPRPHGPRSQLAPSLN